MFHLLISVKFIPPMAQHPHWAICYPLKMWAHQNPLHSACFETWWLSLIGAPIRKENQKNMKHQLSPFSWREESSSHTSLFFQEGAIAGWTCFSSLVISKCGCLPCSSSSCVAGKISWDLKDTCDRGLFTFMLFFTRNLYQQHLRDDVQEGNFWNRNNHLSSGHKGTLLLQLIFKYWTNHPQIL